MIFYWLLLAVILTIVGSLLVLVLYGSEVEHEEEVQHGDRVFHQQASITVARCEADPKCNGEHERAVNRFAAWMKSHLKKKKK